jgi:hypothetical protein
VVVVVVVVESAVQLPKTPARRSSMEDAMLFDIMSEQERKKVQY